MEYTVIRSDRKTMSLQVKPDLTVVVRAPKTMPNHLIDRFVNQNHIWLEQALEETKRRKEFNDRIESPEQQRKLQAAAKAYLPDRTAYWAKIMNLSPTGVRITSAKTRFGSCNAKNSICYSWRLMAYPQEAIDYVIVHELSHIIHKNHSARFYAVVERYLPDWRARERLLKTR